MNFIEVLVVDDHEKYAGCKAILHESDASFFVEIVKTSLSSATVKHYDGSLQKALWGKLSVEQKTQ